MTGKTRDPTAPGEMMPRNAQEVRPYQVFMLALCLFALLALAVETLVPLSTDTKKILEYADFGVCLLFLLDFGVSLATAPDRTAYFLRWGWVDLLSSVPAIPALRIGRAARVLRGLRVLRGVRATKLLASFVLDRRAEGAFLAAALVSMLLVVISSIAVLQFEPMNGGNIRTAGDALWWSYSTITTVGYGDRFPVSPEGRLIGVALMTAGVGLFGTLSGFVASWFLSAGTSAEKASIEKLVLEVQSLRATLRARGLE